MTALPYHLLIIIGGGSAVSTLVIAGVCFLASAFGWNEPIDHGEHDHYYGEDWS